MGFDLFGVDAEFQTEWVAVAPRWIATECHHFKNEGVVAIDFHNRVTAAGQCSNDRFKFLASLPLRIACPGPRKLGPSMPAAGVMHRATVVGSGISTIEMNQPIKHHYVPQFYLAGFTHAGLKDADLYVFDQSLGRSWRSTPKGAGFKKNFHRIANSANGDEMAIEKKLADFEGRWATVLKEIIDSKQLPEGDAFEELMMFVAFMAARVPSIRNKLSEFMSDIHRSMLQLWCASDAGKASLLQTIESPGTTLDDDEFAKLLDFGRSGDYEISIEQTFYIKQIFEIAIPLTGMLSKRQWQLWSIAGEAPDMICSDSPVSPTWIVPPQSPLMSPAFGLEQTIVSVPLHRRMALVGVFEEGLPEAELDAKGVAAINSMTAFYANQVYSSKSNFTWMSQRHEIAHASDWLRQLQESK